MTNLRALGARTFGSLGGAAVGASLVALGESGAVVRASPQVSFAPVFLVSLGLLFPIAVVLGVGVGMVSALLHADAPSPRGLIQTLRAWDENRRERVPAILLGPFAFAAFVFILAGISSRLLSGDLAAGEVGAALALAAVAVAGAVLGVVSTLARRLSRTGGIPWPRVEAAVAIAVGLVVVFGAAGVLAGNTSGAGGFWRILGVFRRDELDLRALGFLVLIASMAYGMAFALERSRLGVLVLMGVMSTALVHTATHGLEATSVRLGVERFAPLSRSLLKPLRMLSDRDSDGASAWFGGGDCEEGNPKRSPAQDDVPGNGIDEDCTGSDARPVAKPKAIVSEPPPSRFDAPLNVVLITVDTLRADLGFAGNPRPVSPNLDRLAEKSVVFERAYSLASYTGKSVGPTLIGKYSSETNRDWSHFNRFSPKDRFLAERLRAAGVHTLSVQGHWYLFSEGFGFERGFDVVDSSAAPRSPQTDADRTVNADKLSDAAISLLGRAELEQKPFFLWVHYLDAHAEYVPHEGLDFGKDQRALYDGEVAFVDRQLGRVLDALESRSFAKKTAIIVTSDHGEAFGEHGMIRHGFELWEELVHVPLVIHVPDVKPKRIAARRSLIDLVPTVLELLRVTPPSGGDALRGQSWVPEIFGSAKAPERPIFIDMSAGPYNGERQALILGDKKIVSSEGNPLGIYDLVRDPLEKENLLEDRAGSASMVEGLKAFRRSLSTVRVTGP